MTINATAGILLALYIAVAKKRGYRVNDLRGTIQNDLLKEYMARGTYIYPPAPSLRIITDIFAHCAEHVPQWNTISISGYHIREAGSTAVQELAFTLSNGLTYVKAAVDRGLDVNVFGRRLSFFFNVHNDFFEEIAKFRAARRLWARLMRERFGASDPKALALRFHAQTAGSSLTAQQPENNVSRVTLQALAAVLGGTQSLHTNGMDEALGLPTEKSATLALRTQQIIAHESGVVRVVDPLGGSFFIESLTNELEAAALDYIERNESLGGVVACLENGFQQMEIQKSAYQFQLDLEAGKQIVVGVNAYQEKEAPRSDILKVSEKTAKEQITRLKKFKKSRSSKVVNAQLERLRNAAASSTNLMPLFIESVEKKLTLGEIAGELRRVFGEHREVVKF
jgi:methylmalonyl-CoA mutase N-terminal domain/subunit